MRYCVTVGRRGAANAKPFCNDVIKAGSIMVDCTNEATLLCHHFQFPL